MSDVKTGGVIRFTRGAVQTAAAGGFEIYQTPASFTDALPFQGKLAVAGPAGLFEYDGEGKLLRWIGTNTDVQDNRLAARELVRLNATLEERVATRTAELDRIWRLSRDLMNSAADMTTAGLAVGSRTPPRVDSRSGPSCAKYSRPT